MRVHQGGVGRVWPPGKNFFGKNLQGQIYPLLDFLRNSRENLKGGTKGNFLD
jgi:hypothetical protein